MVAFFLFASRMLAIHASCAGPEKANCARTPVIVGRVSRGSARLLASGCGAASWPQYRNGCDESRRHAHRRDRCVSTPARCAACAWRLVTRHSRTNDTAHAIRRNCAAVFEQGEIVRMVDQAIMRIALFPSGFDDLLGPDLILGKIDIGIGNLFPHGSTHQRVVVREEVQALAVGLVTVIAGLVVEPDHGLSGKIAKVPVQIAFGVGLASGYAQWRPNTPAIRGSESARATMAASQCRLYGSAS